MKIRPAKCLLAALVVMMLFATACGDDGDTATADDLADETTTTPAPARSEAGCSSSRCEPGEPAPQPLAEPATIKLAAATKGEYLAPVLLGLAMGEFEKENLTVELVQMGTADAIPQLDRGAIDGYHGGPYVSFTNGVAAGFDIKWVLGNYAPADGGDVSVPQAGIWARRDYFSDPENPDIGELAGARIANSQGNVTVSLYWMHDALQAGGASIADVTMAAIPPADQFTAMENNAVAAAFMLDPFWTRAAEEPDKYVLLAVQPKESNGGIFLGTRLLSEEREVGEAFARAYIRTITTYLGEGYKDNDEVIATLADELDMDREHLLAGPELAFDWHVPEGVMDKAQEIFVMLGTQEAGPLPESQLVDRDLAGAVTG